MFSFPDFEYSPVMADPILDSVTKGGTDDKPNPEPLRPLTRSLAAAAVPSAGTSLGPSSVSPSTTSFSVASPSVIPTSSLAAASSLTSTPSTPPRARNHAPPFPIVDKSATKKRRHDFDIFVDNNTTTYVRSPLSAPTTPNARAPLSDRSANSTPSPASRLPDTPFALSEDDHYWEDIENYTPWYLTPPPTPRRPRLPLTPSAGPPPRSSSSRVARPRLRKTKPATATELPVPINMLAYNVLDMYNWKVSADTIKMAYKVAALGAHPDKAATAEEKERATATMQKINAAKDMLLSNRARRQYHRDGKVPWLI